MSKESHSVWLVEDGAYSDYHIVGVFSTRENAELMRVTLDLNEDSIVEWPVDPSIDKLRQGLCCYYIFMLRDGTVQYCCVSMPANEPLPGPQIRISELRSDELAMWIYVWAKDKEGAIKAANEIRIQLIATDQFTQEAYP